MQGWRSEGSIPGVDAICGLSLLSVFVPAPRVFPRVFWFSSQHKNRHNKDSNSTFKGHFSNFDLA